MTERKPGHEIDRTPPKEVEINWIEAEPEDLPPITEVPWSKPSLTPNEWDACWRVFNSGWVTMGEETAKFQAELERFLGCEYVILFDHGTSAILAALLAHEVRRIRIPAYTFPATLNAVHFSQAEPTFGDINPKTVLMEPEEFDGYQMPVSYAGLGIDERVWDRHDVIEDAAEAFGAEIREKKVGGQGWTTCFSFHAAKLITMVEGGAVATNDLRIANKLVMIRSQGENPDKKGVFPFVGLNFRPTDMQAAIGRVQLRSINMHLENRFMASVYYEKHLDDVVDFQEVPDYKFRHANMMMPVFVDDPLGLAAALKEYNVGTRTGWLPYLDTEHARFVYEHVICLPIFNTITKREAEYVAQAVRAILDPGSEDREILGLEEKQEEPQ